MSRSARQEIVRHLERLHEQGTLTGLSAGQLLDRFLTVRDEDAFTALLERYGPMVLSVCRAVLRDPHEAEDAFQATFLLLVLKAKSIRRTECLGGWLHRVARRVARRADRKRTNLMIPAHAISTAEIDLPESALDDESVRLIHDEIDRLSANVRNAIILCDIEGLSHAEAARRLRWPVGTVKGRVAQGRRTLRARLARQGLAFSTPALAAALVKSARATMSSALCHTTTRAAAALLAGRPLGAIVSATIGSLVNGESTAMLVHTGKLVAACLLALGTVAAGGVAITSAQFGNQPERNHQANGLLQVDSPVQSIADPMEASQQTPADDSFNEPNREQPASSGHQAPDVSKRTAPAVDDVTPGISDQERAVIAAKLEAARLEEELLQQRLKKQRQRLLALDDQRDDVSTAVRTGHYVFTGRHAVIGPIPVQGAKAIAKLNFKEGFQELLELVEQERSITFREYDRTAQELLLLKSRSSELAKQLEAPDSVPRKIRPGDVLQVEVFETLPGRPLAGQRVVRPDGTISLGFYGDLAVAGLDRRQIKVKLIEYMRKYLADESLGLVGQDREGKPIQVAPIDSDRVLVDDSMASSRARDKDARNEELVRQVENLQKEVEALRERPK